MPHGFVDNWEFWTPVPMKLRKIIGNWWKYEGNMYDSVLLGIRTSEGTVIIKLYIKGKPLQ